MINIKKLDSVSFFLGKNFLALLFLFSGIGKALNFSEFLELLILRNVPFAFFSLSMCILLQIIFASLLIVNRYIRLSSLILFAVTILINIFMHDFWNFSGDSSQAHETQNFVKNLGIAAGFLILATKEKIN
jgi:putative oxidoreductase